MLRANVTILSLAPGGDGVAHLEIAGERRAVFVAHAAPGDVLSAEIDTSRRPARGRTLELLEHGVDRVTPACPWSTRCGGCDWMHLSIEAQEMTHVEHVRAALPDGSRQMPIHVHRAPAAVGYRTRARVHVRCKRGRVDVGMNESRTHDPVSVDMCVVLAPPIEHARRQLAALFAGSRGEGDVQIALGSGGAAVLDSRWSGDLDAKWFGRVEEAVAARQLAGARMTMEGATRPAVIGDPTPWIVAADGAPLRIGGFAQASEQMSGALARYVAEIVKAHGVEKAVELYAGSGNLSVLLAREVSDLVLVESSTEACEAARFNLAERNLAGRVVEANAEDYPWAPGTKVVVLDPPRTGARAASERLASSRVTHVVYVSCDAQTLARDLKVLAPAYDIRSVATFEMFPQTSHVETVVALDRRRGAAGRA
jgi:23S rRNA (uracil1939-C5)-methyltransferase